MDVSFIRQEENIKMAAGFKLFDVINIRVGEAV